MQANRIALYSHDTLGFGHFRRNLMLAKKLRALPSKPDVMLVAGTYEVGAFDIPDGIEVLTLPAYAKHADGRYTARRLNMELCELRALREAILAATLKRFAPDLLIVDNVPLGAQGELEGPLRKLRKRGKTRLVLGCRDILDDPATVRRQWLRQRHVETINTYFDAVWAYGDPAVYDVFKDCDLTGITAEIVHTGYLLKDWPAQVAPSGGEAPLVLCTVGGGRDGLDLCKAFAAAELPAGHRGIIVPGTQMDADALARIRQIAAGNRGMQVVPFVPDLMPLMAAARRIVAMGGYNTTCEILALKKPALIVPRVAPRTEQLIRARALSDRGLVDICHPRGLSPTALSEWMARPIPRAASHGIRTDGLASVAALAQAALYPDYQQIAAE